jgi:hypothetical protein
MIKNKFQSNLKRIYIILVLQRTRLRVLKDSNPYIKYKKTFI